MSRDIKPVEEMAQDLALAVESGKRTKDIYKAQSGQYKKEQLQADIGRALSSLDTKPKKVDLNNFEEVQERTEAYLKACQIAGVYPSVQGLASHGFGVCRQWVNAWKNQHPDSETAQYLDRVFDMMADILTNESLHNNANVVQAIFQMKNNHAFSDKMEIQPVKAKEEITYNIDEIRARYDM